MICEKCCCVVQFKLPLSGKFPLEIFSETMIQKAWFWTISLCILSPLVPGYAVQGDEKVKYFQKENEMTRLARWYRDRNWVRGGCLDKVNDKECNCNILMHILKTETNSCPSFEPFRCRTQNKCISIQVKTFTHVLVFLQ